MVASLFLGTVKQAAFELRVKECNDKQALLAGLTLQSETQKNVMINRELHWQGFNLVI